MNVEQVMNTVEKTLLCRQLSSLERFILSQSWLGRGYSEMASECAYSIAHIKDIGAQLWQALSTAIGQRVTKKNLFLVLKQYWLSMTGETVASDPLSVPLELVEVIDAPLTPTTERLPIATDFVEPSYSEDSKQLPRKSDRVELVSEENERLERGLQEYQTYCDHIETENNLKVPVTQSQLSIPSDRPPLDSSLYINRLKCAINHQLTEFIEWDKIKSAMKLILQTEAIADLAPYLPSDIDIIHVDSKGEFDADPSSADVFFHWRNLKPHILDSVLASAILKSPFHQQ
jgi:hypothetical protein